MRRFLLVLLGGLLSTAVFAQSNVPTQIGRATQELPDPGLYAAHFTIPLGSTVTIANADTGEEIDVIIVSRIPMSSTRIIDLSFDAWEALGLTEDTEVVINPNNEANRAPVASIPAPAPASPSFDEEDAEDAEDAEYAETEYAEAEVEEPPKGKTAAVLTRSSIKVVPGLPNPNSRKFYRLQVGAYAVKENADIAERVLKTAGFDTQREARGSLTRVLAVGIAAADVKLAVKVLEDAGFGEVWIRE